MSSRENHRDPASLVARPSRARLRITTMIMLGGMALATASAAHGQSGCWPADINCDGTIDEDDAADAGTWYADADGDG
ncbi:MAG: hypothetical protein MK085_03935 [Phycisphaerales bacterium]|nr:hypothetical protein [Phycisphaerales bacterium]